MTVQYLLASCCCHYGNDLKIPFGLSYAKNFHDKKSPQHCICRTYSFMSCNKTILNPSTDQLERIFNGIVQLQ